MLHQSSREMAKWPKGRLSKCPLRLTVWVLPWGNGRTCAYSSVAALSAALDSRGNDRGTALLTDSNEVVASEARKSAHHVKITMKTISSALICLKYLVAKVFVRICRSDERVAYMGAVSQRTQPMIYYIWRLFIVFMIMYLCHALKQFSEYGFYYFAS